MTVHDSVVLDVPKSLLHQTAKLAKETLEKAPQYMKSVFNIDFPCKLGVGVEAGLNWQDKTELKEI
jgi:DNA polymerase I-like protein with 3'-5' exonuclease and polymerase domains